MKVSQALREVADELRSELRHRDRALLPADVAGILDRIADRIDSRQEHVPYNPDAYMELDYDCC